MVIPALSLLRFLGAWIGPIAWVVFGVAVIWFVLAIRHAPSDIGETPPDAVPPGTRPHSRPSA